MKYRMALRDQGISVGVRFNISAIDGFTSGLQPTELVMAGGESGVGKSAVWWKAAMNFAADEAKKPPEQGRIGTAIFSLEMGEDALVDALGTKSDGNRQRPHARRLAVAGRAQP
jgi:replicative DNA helicase